MVCSFFLFVLPALLWKVLSGFYRWITGTKAEVPVEAEPAKQPAAAKGVCPDHVVLRFFGFQIPDKKAKAKAAPAQPAADDRVKAE